MKTTKIYKINDELSIATIRKVNDNGVKYYAYFKVKILGNNYVIMPSRDFNVASLYLLLEDNCQGLLVDTKDIEVE